LTPAFSGRNRDQRSEKRAGEAFSDDNISPTGDQFLTLRAVEDHYIEQVLAATGNNKRRPARILAFIPHRLQRPAQGAGGGLEAISKQAAMEG